jgi:hypothetical protein
MATKMTREEAIKIVQSATVWTDEERDALAMLIPELAESEDERIRKAIIGIIKNSNVIDINVSHERMLAYLEKQKVQKPGEIPPYVTGIKSEPDPAGVWKPSEEQMKALLKAEVFLRAGLHYDSAKTIAELYEQLKKL